MIIKEKGLKGTNLLNNYVFCSVATMDKIEVQYYLFCVKMTL